ncbi:peptidyl-prolyl cis-trans isomerase [Streptomyces sp. TRM68367]|uniref:peptidyl-prolyl cis-trans isomerase n=1 Tax=Streptomyces sp. TRM68367 TaxID=2758415 RepID=UPI00165B06A0|nr:peptidyl-prolyl cis-trans isomerase [Streptomyces sp. TRM68367]MBC9731100.1 peptidyl-prolyl cis-trans isomerase [Streptomyces sp. TRM68367]
MKGTLPKQGTSRKPNNARKPSNAGRPTNSRRPGASRKPRASRGASTSSTPHTSRRPSRRAVLLVTGVCIALTALVVTGVTLLRDHRTENEVASLDGHPVTRDELLFHMRRLAPTVQNELRNKYHLVGPVDWNAKAGDKTALQRLETRALDEIRQDKTTLILAKQQGLVDSVDYADFLADLAKENQSRADAIAAGQTVYGLAQFSPEEYYTHRLTELTTNLKKRLSANPGDPLWVTDAEVRRAFDADRDAWSANATTYTYSQLVVPVPAGASADYAARLQRRVAAAKRLAAVAAGVPGAKLTTGTYGGSGSTGLNAHDQDLMAVLGKLRPGHISAPVKGTGQITYYELDGKKVDEDKAFADYRGRIRQSLVEEKFDKYLQRRVRGSDIDVDTSAVDAINAKDVQQ